jgi:hypothetical protein
MEIPWATNLLHFHLNKLFKKCFLMWHYFVGQLFWLLLKKLGDFFFKSSGHPDRDPNVRKVLPLDKAGSGQD